MSSGDLTRARRVEDGELYCPTCDASYPSGTLAHCPNDGTKLVHLHEARDPLIGRNVDGRFVIKSRIGAGGMGAVYLAIQGSVGREVAIKVIESRLSAGKLAAKRFLREAKLSSRLSQPNTVTVLDFGQTEDGLLYLVMELVKGRTLGDVLAGEGPFTVERMAKVGVQLCDALEAAHRLSIIHRDLKPSNVILLDDPPGRDHIKVLDFGLAKSLTGEGESTTMTQSDAIMGTPSYIPPEAVIKMQFDARSDLYSLGVILYELIAGELPFSGTTVQMMLRQHAYDKPKPLPASIPPQVQQLLERMLEKDPDRRVQTAVEVRAELQALLADPAISGASRGGRPASHAPIRAPYPGALSQSHISAGYLTTMVTPLANERVRPRRWPWLVLPLLVAGGVTAALLATGGGSHGGEPAAGAAPATTTAATTAASGTTAEPTAPTPAPAPTSTAPTTPPATPTGEPEPASGAAAALATVELHFVAEPPAIVFVDGERLGRSPQTKTVLRSETPLEVRFERSGYKTERFEVTPTQNGNFQRDLEKLADPKPRKPLRKPSTKSQPEKPTQPERPKFQFVPTTKN